MYILQEERAPNPRRVRLFLAEKGIEIEYRQCNIMNGEHKTPEFEKLNPFQRLPVLVLDDGRAISETVAICRYFEKLHPEPALFGDDAADQAIVEMWQRRVEYYLLGPVSYIFRHRNPNMAALESPQVPEWSNANIDKLKWMLDFLDQELKDRPFIAGEKYSIADITALCAIDFMRIIKMRIDDCGENLQRWYQSVSSRANAGA